LLFDGPDFKQENCIQLEVVQFFADVWCFDERHDPLDGADPQLVFGQAQDTPSRHDLLVFRLHCTSSLIKMSYSSISALAVDHQSLFPPLSGKTLGDTHSNSSLRTPLNLDMKNTTIIMFFIPFCLLSCESKKIASMEHNVRTANETTLDLKRSFDETTSELKKSADEQKEKLQMSENQVRLIINNLDLQQKCLAEIGLKIDSETAKRKAMEQDKLELEKSLNATEKALTSLKQAITERDQQQREAAMVSAERETQVREQIDKEAEPIKERIKQLDTQRSAVEARMTAVMNTPVRLNVGDTIEQTNKFLQHDMAFKQQLLDKLKNEASLIDNAIEAQRVQLRGLYR